MKQMNLFRRAVVAIVMTLCMGFVAQAHDFEVDGIYYNITSENTVGVTYKGSYYDSYSNEYTGSVVIPKSVRYNVTTYSVTSIENSAFYGCTSLTSVAIGNSVTNIEGSAFYECTGLTAVYITDLDAWCKIDFEYYGSSNPLYYAKNLYLNNEKVTNLVLPNTITEIKNYTFYNCSGLSSVTIPNSVTSIGVSAFKGCTGLSSVTIPNSVTSIGPNAFRGCTGLTSIVVESGNTVYDSRENCNSIIETSTNTLITGCKTSIIPNSVTSIGEGAFEGCTGLTCVTLPNSVTSIGASAFRWCNGLTSVTIGNSVTSIGGYAFDYCSGLTSITIPNSVTTIGKNAFYNTGWYNNQSDGILYLDKCCLGYKGNKPTGALTLKEDTRLIADYAFVDCDGLTCVEIPNSVTSIGASAFSWCNGLTSVTIGNSVTSIGGYAFYGCTGLTSITIPNSVTSIGGFAFYGCTGLTSVTIGNSVTYIGVMAFMDCSGLTSITIPNSVTSIESYAFCNCSGLTSVTIGNSVTSIGASAFDRCSGLTSVTIGNSVTSIGGYAFYGCTGLTSVEIPNSVTSIGSFAFYDCDGLKSIECKAIEPPTLGNKAFSNISSFALLRVPIYSLFKYTSTAGWGNFNYSKEPYEINGIYYYPNSETEAYVTYKDTNYNSYSGSISIPSEIAEHGSTLKITGINEKAFYKCTTLKNVIIGKNVSQIGDSSFNGCYNIRTITSLNSIPPVCGTDVFKEVKTEAVALTVPQESVSLYENASTWMDFWNITGKDLSGVEETLADDVDTPAEYYNLNGVRVENPEKGVYIKRQGGKTTKVVK